MPLLDVVGNRPVWLVDILPVTFIGLMSTFCDRLFLFCVAIGALGGVMSFVFVERMFCLN